MGCATDRGSSVPTHALASSGVNTMWLRGLTTCACHQLFVIWALPGEAAVTLWI